MLTCIRCSKQRVEDGEDAPPRGTPATKDAVKSITAQIKDMALKVSKCKPGPTEFDAISEDAQYPYVQPATSSCTPSALGRDDGRNRMIEDEQGPPKEWTAQVEPGIQISFLTLPRGGGNDLKRIRFSREMFGKEEAQRWWGENFDRIMELYNVRKSNALNTPGRSEDGRDSSHYSRLPESPRPRTNKEESNGRGFPPNNYNNNNNNNNGSSTHQTSEMSNMDASRATTSSRDEGSVSMSNASEIESEWIEEDEPGVFLTIRQLVDGTRELRRVRFSRERFGELHAKRWWETHRDRVQAQYL